MILLVSQSVEGSPPDPPARIAPDLSASHRVVREGIEALEGEVARLEALGDSAREASGELAQGYGRLGEVYHAHGFKEAAEAAYGNALQLEIAQGVADPRLTYLLACVLEESGRLEEASGRLREVLAQRPADAPTLLRAGEVELGLGRLDRAGAYFDRALVGAGAGESPAVVAAARFGLGRTAFAGGEPRIAIEHFERALAADPEASAVHYPLAQAYRRVGLSGKTEKHLALRGEREPRAPDPILASVVRLAAVSALQVVLADAAVREGFSAEDFLGFAIARLGGSEGAIEALDAAIEARTAATTAAPPFELSRLHYAAGGLLAARSRDEAAGRHLRTAVELQPGFVEAHLELAGTLVRRGRGEEAGPVYERILALDPFFPEALLGRSNLLLTAGRDGAAVLLLRRLIRLQPDSPKAVLLLATALLRLGRADEAEETWRRALELPLDGREEAFALQNLARLAEGRGKSGEAEGLYRKALAVDPETVEARLALAALLGRTDRFAEAREEYSAVVAARPRHENARVGEVTALILGGDLDGALRRLEEGREAIPGSEVLHHLLARMLAAAPRRELRDGARAVELAGPLFERRKLLLYGETLAMALAESAAFDRAAQLQRSLLAATRDAGDLKATARLKADLERYESGRRCCAASGPSVLLPVFSLPGSGIKSGAPPAPERAPG